MYYEMHVVDKPKKVVVYQDELTSSNQSAYGSRTSCNDL